MMPLQSQEQTQARIKNGKIIEVQSVSLNEVMETNV